MSKARGFPRVVLLRLLFGALVVFVARGSTTTGLAATDDKTSIRERRQEEEDRDLQRNRYGGPSVCRLLPDVGPCDAVVPRWFYNATAGRCEMFTWGGCEGNENNFETLRECKHDCVCTQPADPGPCRALFRSWFYDATIGKCAKFIYGGCRGNENNFASRKQCNEACPLDRCDLLVDPGPCRGSFNRWYYNSDTATCEMFTYGGCQGNANNFETPRGCETACDTCKLPAETGPCRAAVPRWYYRSHTNRGGGRCERFTYGGCQGNDNNFASGRDCRVTCSPAVDDCRRCMHFFHQLRRLVVDGNNNNNQRSDCEAECKKSAAPTYDIRNSRCPDLCAMITEKNIRSGARACEELDVCPMDDT